MPLYELKCPKCGNKEEVILPINGRLPLCIYCPTQMQRSYGSIAFYRMKGDIQGETPGSRKYAKEITIKEKERLRKERK